VKRHTQSVCHARRWLCGAGVLLLLGGCGTPTPDTVVAQCTQAVAAKKYERVLPYCTPALRQVYSNNLTLAQYHRHLATSTTFAVEPAELYGDTAAVVRLTMTVATRQMGTATVPLQVELVRHDKWYVHAAWRVSADGRIVAPALPDVPAPLF
jgi:hypothetical protein